MPRTYHVDWIRLGRLKENAGLSIELLAQKAGVSKDVVFNMLSGRRAHQLGTISAVASVFELTAGDLLAQPGTASRPSSVPPTSAPVPPTSGDVSGGVPSAPGPPEPPLAPADDNAPQQAPSITGEPTLTRPQVVPRSILDWMTTRPLSIVTGNRRQNPPRYLTDMSLSVAWTDFALIARFKGAAHHDVVPDDAVVLELLDGGDGFRESLAAIGASDVNMLTMLLNPSSIWKFRVDENTRSRVLTMFAELHQLPEDERLQRTLTLERELADLRRDLSPHAFFDPMLWPTPERFVRGKARGLVSIAEHPTAQGVVCLLAAGVNGPLTAGAGALLAGRKIYDPYTKTLAGLESRWAGGIFQRVGVPQRPPLDILHIERELEWVTPPYDLATLLARLASEEIVRSLGSGAAARLADLVTRFATGTHPVPPTTRFGAILPSGGEGRRMAHLSDEGGKLNLRVGASPILSWSIQALAGTGVVDEVVLVSRPPFAGLQQRVASELAGPSLVVEVLNERPAGWFGTAAERMREILRRGLWCIVAMPDVLIPPSAIAYVLATAVETGAAAAVATVEVPLAHASRYGTVRMRDGRVGRIVEKEREAIDTHACCGLFVFSPLVESMLLPSARGEANAADNIVALLNSLCDRVHVLRVGITSEIWDCGSPDGYKAAVDHASTIKALWATGPEVYNAED